MSDIGQKWDPKDMTATIVSAFVARNVLAPGDLPLLIRNVHQALSSIGGNERGAAMGPAEPAVAIKKSIAPDYLTCLEDGKRFRSLKRHLATHHNLSPGEYRAKWGLGIDYPMVAPNYAQTRSRLAKQMGLGQRAEPPKRTRSRRSA